MTLGQAIVVVLLLVFAGAFVLGLTIVIRDVRLVVTGAEVIRPRTGVISFFLVFLIVSIVTGVHTLIQGVIGR
ncbi:hypothetical protein [Herbiconiux sp. L3-i23]|uniref:hypothetical protein n=1 Tax=Herbiconiux sp. L3-i23 TaxID=2905871 RepID=UPI002049524A|nr:hypothetical protein [Herbiconiux sp. L3-i23]BDI21822.1 hypothetical protein L3i23_05980 [Herbiconiux sp. L3-i23]